MYDPIVNSPCKGQQLPAYNIDDENIHLSEKEGKTDGGDDVFRFVLYNFFMNPN